MGDELQQPSSVVPERLFGRVVCGTDGSPASLDISPESAAVARRSAGSVIVVRPA